MHTSDSAVLCMCVGRSGHARPRRIQYCAGFLDVDGRWNNGFFCHRRPRTAAAYQHRTQSRPQSHSGRTTSLHPGTGCCGNDTHRFCCDVTPSAHPPHYTVTSSLSLSSAAASVDGVQRYQLVRCTHEPMPRHAVYCLVCRNTTNKHRKPPSRGRRTAKI